MPYNSLVSRADVASLIPEEVSSAMLTSLETQSAALALATRIPVARNQVRFPVLSALPTAYFVSGDTGLKQTTEAAWANKFLDIEELAAIVPIPEAVLEDADFDLWAALRPLLEGAIARALDAAVFFGASKPASWPSDIVTAAVAAGNVVARGTNNAAAGGIFGDYSDVLGKLEGDGYIPNGAVGNITLKARERQVRDANGQPIVRPADVPDVMFESLAGLWPTGLSAAELIVGDFRRMVVGVRQDFTYKVLTEGVITDNAGAIIYNLPQQDMIALRVVFRVGWQVANPVNHQNATENTRFPFAVLRSPAS